MSELNKIKEVMNQGLLNEQKIDLYESDPKMSQKLHLCKTMLKQKFEFVRECAEKFDTPMEKRYFNSEIKKAIQRELLK